MVFLASLILLTWSSLRWAGHPCLQRADRFWVVLACALLQLGALASVSSLVYQLTAPGWLTLQALLLALSLRCTGDRPHFSWGALRATVRRRWLQWRAFANALSLWGGLALLTLGLSLVCSLAFQIATPIHGFDERMYHASRVIYWIQQQSVLPFESHNIRQSMLPFGSELLFLWSVLLTKSELVGRLVFWSAYPIAATCMYLLLRTLRTGRTAALLGALVLVLTPLIATTSLRMKPELWSVVCLLGTAYWAVSLCQSPSRAAHAYAMLGLFCVLSINVRPFALALVPGVLLLTWRLPHHLPCRRRLRALLAGATAALLLSGLLIPLVANALLYHHPLGPAPIRQLVQADTTWLTFYTHSVRFLTLLLELPDVPASAGVRNTFSNVVNGWMSTVGAGGPLPGEHPLTWNTPYRYELREQASYFSLWGLLWIPVLAVAVASVVGSLVALRRQQRITPVAAIALLTLPLMAGILWGSRWMSSSDVPARFLIGPYALMLVIGVVLLARNPRPGKWRQLTTALVLIGGCYPAAHVLATQAVQAFAEPRPGQVFNEPFDEVVGSLLPAGARILLVGLQDARDYPLFAPRDGYTNTVVSWGAGPFDAERVQSLIVSQRISHILVQNDRGYGHQGFPRQTPGPMLDWLAARPGIKQLTLKTPGMRLFEISAASPAHELPYQFQAAPAHAPLITLAPGLAGQVGVHPRQIDTPWIVEDLGGAERGFFWMGQGCGEGIGFELWSRQTREVTLNIDVAPGPSLTEPGRNLVVLQNDAPIGAEHRFNGRGVLALTTQLAPGRNTMRLCATDAASVRQLANGDTRRLVVGLHGVAVEGAVVQPTPPVDATAPVDADLAQAARQAIGTLIQRLQPDGYWVTTHTPQPQYVGKTVEMNTFLTAHMVDLLGRDPVPELVGTLARARGHLREQIEPTGLVRYHGRPDAKAMTDHGLCAITPDADDTALAWRLAPADAALRPQALNHLAAYRTAEGLYKTWLAPRSGYRCIDPGADPNPTDIAIQMHVLLWLAQEDPPRAAALCTALRRHVDQDRLWVYYRQAPLVPMLRQDDMRRAGCALPLPPARLQTPVAEQQPWLSAAQMLQRLAQAPAHWPRASDVRQLLAELAADNFSSMRIRPPLMYHNDLSATVPRFYWSEDFGFALWLRLYRDALQRGLLPPSATP
jgi:hypothetical protein